MNVDHEVGRWCVTHSLTTTRAPSLGSQVNPSQVDGEHGSPFHDSSISFSRFLSDSSSLNRFATSAVSKSSRKKSPPSHQKEAPHRHQILRKTTVSHVSQSARRKSFAHEILVQGVQSTKETIGTTYWRANSQELEKGFGHGLSTTNKTTLGEALGWRGGGKNEEQRGMEEEEEAGGHTMGDGRFRCRPAEGREACEGWKGSAVGRLVGALFCSVAACLLALGTAVDSDGDLFFPLNCSGASPVDRWSSGYS